MMNAFAFDFLKTRSIRLENVEKEGIHTTYCDIITICLHNIVDLSNHRRKSGIFCEILSVASKTWIDFSIREDFYGIIRAELLNDKSYQGCKFLVDNVKKQYLLNTAMVQKYAQKGIIILYSSHVKFLLKINAFSLEIQKMFLVSTTNVQNFPKKYLLIFF